MNMSAVTLLKQKNPFGADILCSPYKCALTEKDILLPISAEPFTSKYELEKQIVLAARSTSHVCFGLNGLCYPPCESSLRLTERMLELMYDLKCGITVITKSDIVLRDAGLIATIAARSSAQVVIPIFCEDGLCQAFEPQTVSSSFRFEMINRLSSSGIRCGIMLTPVIPYLTDAACGLRRLVKKAADAGAKFAVCEPFLRLSGEQKPIFASVLDRYFPQFIRFYGTFADNLFFPPRSGFITDAVIDECRKNDLDLIQT